MLQRHLGRSGLRVSRLGLGTLTWGRDTDQHEAAELLRAYRDAGGTFLDTADAYGDGASEAVIGQLLTDVVPRAEVVIATKSGACADGRPADGSRRHLLASLDASLARLRTDHVDLWLVQAWDPVTPLEETLAALDAAVSTGRARYVGVSNFTGWQTAAAATWQRAVPGRNPVAAVEVEYSLLARDAEREVLPAATGLGIGVLAWSPLARGALTGKYRYGIPSDSRAASDHLAGFVQPYLGDVARRVVDAVATAADGLGASPLEVALAWVRDRSCVASAIVGSRTTAQLVGALASEELELPPEIRQALDDVSGDGTRPRRGPGRPVG